jgi:multisubunit Na+/H+ antiporter MnhF subunit
MAAVALLAAALSLSFFPFSLRFLKGPIGRRRLVGVLGISANALLQFFGTPLQLVERMLMTGTMEPIEDRSNGATLGSR